MRFFKQKVDLWNFRHIKSRVKSWCIQDDMWFVGIIFYQLITGQPFFQMDSDELESMEEQGVCVSGTAPQKETHRSAVGIISLTYQDFLQWTILSLESLRKSLCSLEISAHDFHGLLSGFCRPWIDAV